MDRSQEALLQVSLIAIVTIIISWSLLIFSFETNSEKRENIYKCIEKGNDPITCRCTFVFDCDSEDRLLIKK